VARKQGLVRHASRRLCTEKNAAACTAEPARARLAEISMLLKAVPTPAKPWRNNARRGPFYEH